MKDYSFSFDFEGKKYEMILNLNVLKLIQEKYGTVKKWGELTDAKNGEINIEALLFGYTEMLNEATEISNDEKNEDNPFFTEKQVGRLVSKMGMKAAAERLNNAVVEGTKSEIPKN